MKKLLTAMALIAMTGCTPLPMYSPKLATPAASQAQYESDVSACKDKVISDAMDRARSHAALDGLGGVGGLIGDAATPRQKEPYLLVNDCMTAKGYKIAGDGK